MKKSSKQQQRNTCPSNTPHFNQSQEVNCIQFDLLTLNDRKTSYNQSQLQFLFKEVESQNSLEHKIMQQDDRRLHQNTKKNKLIQKRQRQSEDQKKINFNRRRKISCLQQRIQELQREVASLRRNEDYCLYCRNNLPDHYRERMQEIIQPEEPATASGDAPNKRNSKDSLEFEKIDFHTPLMQTQQMQQKMWIFVGTMLIAMGSKVMDFDGTINVFKVLKHSVDNIRRQVEKSQTKLGLQFFCCKEQLKQPRSFIDGVGFDPFYSAKQDAAFGNFTLEGVRLQSVEEYQLFYDYKYNFNIKYDALLTIMQYARDNCSIS